MTISEDSKKAAEIARYEATWRYIRAWERAINFSMGLLVILIVTYIALSSAKPGGSLLVIAAFVMLAIMAGAIRPKCPRCGEQFFKSGLLRDGTEKNKCVHCGLPKDVLGDPDS